MPLDFPDSPSTNDTYTSGGITWKYDGAKWRLVTGSITAASAGTITGTNAEGTSTSFARADHDHALGMTWATWTPTWTAAGTNPTPADHTISAKYIQIAKLVTFTLRITFGSSGFGSGLYTFTYPVTAASNTTRDFVYAAQLLDLSPVGIYAGSGFHFSSTEFRAAFGNNVNAFGPATPITLASGDVLVITGTYEAA